MTEHDDGLAPVTPLFGAKSPGSRRSSGRASGAAASAGETADGWALSATPGADEAGAAEAGAGEAGADQAWDDEAGAVEHSDDDAAGSASDGRADGGAGTSTHPSTRRRASALRAVDGDATAIVSPLPTYAAFAAKTEGPDSGVRFDDDEPPEPEPEGLEAAQKRAENISLHALSRRGVSSHEMAKTLRSRDLPEEVVIAEVERLERVGLLDDAELAENLVRTKQDRKGLGKQAITAELRQRGIAQEAIEQAVSEIDDDEEQARCDEWALKRAGQLRGLDQATAERRLNAFLMRRGYRSEVIRRAVERALPRGGRGGGVRFD